MNRALLRLSLACLAMFVLLLVNVNYVQAFEAGSLAGKPGNVRVFNQQFQYQRGSIIAAGSGQNYKIAESVPVKDSNTFQRVYPGGATYAPVTGFSSIYGATGIEQAEQKYLAGTAPSLAVHNLIDLVTGKPKQGATVYLTISPKAQKAAYRALLADGGHQAAAVAIDPQHRRDPGPGVVPDVQPEPAHHAQRPEVRARSTTSCSETRRSRCSTGPSTRPTRRAPRSRS